ncbi:MAG: FAD-binding oxidoreductase [Chloroflexi bacterium]|nr:MAG: FAD-binding oxidoreductase [Chloroflexota bacterium]
MEAENLRWWGWGRQGVSYSLEGRERFWPFLRERLGISGQVVSPPLPLEAILLPPSRLTPKDRARLERLVGPDGCRTDRQARIEHAYGKGYRDLIRARRGEFPHPPDAVLYPSDERQVTALLAWAAEREVAVIPFGGGSSVTGGVEPPADRPAITLDLARLNRVLALDPRSQTATVEAGILGPDLEAALNDRGFTLGHFPQSFQFSTLGGWIATRGAGATSIRYGKIEAMVEALRVVTPVGVIETSPLPAEAAGPDLKALFIGSEGTLGVITQATLRIHPLPSVRRGEGLLFPSFEAGVEAVRRMLQSGTPPAMVRLSDAQETTAYWAFSPTHQGWKGVRDRLVAAYLARRGYGLDQGSCLMVVQYEGSADEATLQRRTARRARRAYGGLTLGSGPFRAFYRDRYATPYLRDLLLDYGLMVDTLETATTWERLLPLYQALTQAIRRAILVQAPGALVMTHLSHAYRDGGSLYVTFMARQAKDPIAQWRMVKRAAMEAIIAHGGAVSHHHGVGRDHAPWLARQRGPQGMEALRALKRTLDPQGVMNPGVLL